MNSKSKLLLHLEKNTKVFQDTLVKNAFEHIDRKDFVPDDLEEEAYEDYPLPIGYEQTISQPTTVAFMLELLAVKPGMKILDLGCGSGWTTALLATMVGANGKIYGVELIPELVELGRHNIEKYDFDNINIFQADKKNLGLPNYAPFNRILVSAAAHNKIPKELVNQLKPSGKMIIPVDNTLIEVTKTKNNTTTKKAHYSFAFVPLIQDN